MLRAFRSIDAAALSALIGLVAGCAESSAPIAPKDQFRTELITCQASVRAGTLDCAASLPQAARGVSFDLVLGGQGALVRLASSDRTVVTSSRIQCGHRRLQCSVNASPRSMLGRALL